MLDKAKLPDGRPTMSEWPVRIWDIKELPPQYEASVRLWIQGAFSDYEFVYAPKRKTCGRSFDYLFGYGKDKILYLKTDSGKNANTPKEEATPQAIGIQKQQVTKVLTKRELLNASIILHYMDQDVQKMLDFPYVPSVYYLYDPFLNWLLGLDKDFVPALAEREHPRPQKLYHESLAMFNYSLGAYRLGEGFEEYRYEAEQHRSNRMPWKKGMEEWLVIRMERGMFELHRFGYLTECTYSIALGDSMDIHT